MILCHLVIRLTNLFLFVYYNVIVMKIYPIQNFASKIYSKPSFSSSISLNQSPIGNSHNGKGDDEKKQLPDWARKMAIGTLVVFAVQSDPNVKKIFNQEDIAVEEPDKTEFVEDLQKYNKTDSVSSAFYQLGQLYDVETPKIQKLSKNKYQLDFDLDNQKISLDMNINENKKDTIIGEIRTENGENFKYKAIFPDDAIEQFKILLVDKDTHKQLILGRDYEGDLYKITNGKKVVLNSKNVERYQKQIDGEENDFGVLNFFTDKNPMWRKLNYLLLAYLVLNEMCYDRIKRNKEEEENNNKTDEV